MYHNLLKKYDSFLYIAVYASSVKNWYKTHENSLVQVYIVHVETTHQYKTAKKLAHQSAIYKP